MPAPRPAESPDSSGCIGVELKAVHGLMTKRGTAETEAKGEIDSTQFERTIRRMLSTPHKAHKPAEKTKGAAPKRDPSSSGKGSEG
jgi:hypothetical protein